MVKIKFDVSESDPAEAAAAGNFDSPKPGLYPFTIKECNPGFSKSEETGKPDPKMPRIEVVFSCDSPDYKGAQIWGYFVMPGHPKYDKKAAQKFDQLLLAVKFTDGKKNRKGELDTDKHIVGKKVVCRVRGGKTQSGDYRGEFGSVFPEGHAGAASASASADEEIMEDDSMAEDEVIDDDTIAEDEVAGEDTDWEAREAELTGADVPSLKEIAKAYELKITGMKKSEVVQALLEFEKAMVPDGDDGEILEDDEIMDDDEPIVEDTSNYLTREGLAAMETAEIARIAKEDFDLTIKGKKKSEVIDMIITAQAAPADVDPDKPPF